MFEWLIQAEIRRKMNKCSVVDLNTIDPMDLKFFLHVVQNDDQYCTHLLSTKLKEYEDDTLWVMAHSFEEIQRSCRIIQMVFGKNATKIKYYENPLASEIPTPANHDKWNEYPFVTHKVFTGYGSFYTPNRKDNPLKTSNLDCGFIAYRVTGYHETHQDAQAFLGYR